MADSSTPPESSQESVPEPTAPPQEKTLAELAPARYECRSCGYVYEPAKGDDAGGIEPGTRFEDLSIAWRCPVCGARRTAFANIGSSGAPSGFQENLGYGFGVNQLTPSQKNVLIFGGLAIGFLFFISLYGLR